jgi:hypothetical protein
MAVETETLERWVELYRIRHRFGDLQSGLPGGGRDLQRHPRDAEVNRITTDRDAVEGPTIRVGDLDRDQPADIGILLGRDVDLARCDASYA